MPKDRRSRRERELASLYSIARSLTALGEVEEVLRAIVKSAHELMGVDLAYLSVIDGDRLRLRAVSGAVSANFAKAEISTSTGIGARVIASGSPYWSSNYLAEASIEHSSDFDALVIDEGLVALLGVPLLAQSRVQGILYVADRVERPYAPDEVALLSALADHASIALENARLYHASRSALAHLQSAYRMIERSAQVHEALGRLVLTGGTETDIALLLHDALGGQVTMLDRNDSVVATSPELPQAVEPSNLRSALIEARRLGRSFTQRVDEGWQTVTAIAAGDAHLGAVAWTHRQPASAIDIRTVERASNIAGLLTLKQEAVYWAEERLRGELLTELMRSSQALSPELVTRGRAVGLDLAEFNMVAVVRTEDRTPDFARRHLAVEALARHGLVGVYAGHATLALRGEDLSAVVRDLHSRLRGALRLPVLVCGAPMEVQGGFARSFALASRCAEVLAAAGIDDAGTTTVENGMYAVLFDPERSKELAHFLAGTIGPVLSYDRQHRTALVDTLATYFANESNVARTAKDLHVHSNTVLKRLDRVAKCLGDDWTHPNRTLPIRLALRLHQLKQRG